MKLNCKPGDLAIVVSAGETKQMIGAIVLCERLASDGEILDGTRLELKRPDLPCWLVSAAGESIPVRLQRSGLVRRKQRFIGDRFLRPLRDDPGTDEVLRIAGKPNEVNA